MNTSDTLTLGRLALMLGEQRRTSLHEDGLRPVSGTTHTFLLGLLTIEAVTWWRREALWNNGGCTGLPDPACVLALVQVHGLVEALCGDRISQAEHQSNPERRAHACVDLRDILRATPKLLDLLEEYEHQRTLEVRLVHYLDAAVPVIFCALNGGVAPSARSAGYAELAAQHDTQFRLLAAALPDIHGALGPWVKTLMDRSALQSGGVYSDAAPTPVPQPIPEEEK